MKTISSLALSLALAVPLGAQVLPPDAVVDGRTMGDWLAAFTQWLQPIPATQSPARDTNGMWANVGQPQGPVFFLARGGNISLNVTRRFSVPEGKYLFASILVNYADNVGYPEPYTVEQLRDLVDSSIDLITQLHLEIDGVAVPDLFSYRVNTPVFSLEITDTNSLFAFNLGFPFTGVVDPIVAGGYCVMIEPLPPGEHVIRFSGTVGPPVNLVTSVTDIITVVPIPLEERVGDLIGQVEGSDLAENRKRPLLSTLYAARATFERDNLEAGANQMNAFVNKVRAQVAPGSHQLAEAWTEAARVIIERTRGE